MSHSDTVMRSSTHDYAIIAHASSMRVRISRAVPHKIGANCSTIYFAFTLCVIELWHRCKKTYQTSRNGCRPEAADASGADARGPVQQRRLVFPSHAPPRQDHAVRLPRLPRNSQLYRLPGTQISPKSTTVKELGDSQQNKDS